MRDRDYAFRKPWLRALAGALDACGFALRRALGPRRVPPPRSPRRVLLVRLDHLGDGVFIGPALAALRRGLPEARLVLLGGPWAATLFGATPHLDAVQVAEVPWFARPRRRGGVVTWLRILRWMQRERFDAAIDFRGDVRHLAWFALARIPVRLGYGRTGGGFLLSHAVPYRRVHEVERNLDLVRELVPDAVAGPLLPVPFSPEDARQVERLLEDAGCDPRRPLVVFHVTTGYASKRWEPEAMARVIDLVQARGEVQAVIVGAAAERDAVEPVVRHARSTPRVLAGRTSLGELAALLARAGGFVGHDSGPGHLAVAAGIPSVLVYSGVNDMTEWGPWGGRVRVLSAPAPCSPCGLAVCNRDHECMRPIAPEAVAAGLRELVAAEAQPGSVPGALNVGAAPPPPLRPRAP